MKTGNFSYNCNYKLVANRYYNPRISQFNATDPLAEKYYFQSPYTYATDNPVGLMDVDGMGVDKKEDDYFYNSKTGETHVVKTNDKKDNLYVDGDRIATLTKGQLGKGYTNQIFGIKKPMRISNEKIYRNNTDIDLSTGMNIHYSFIEGEGAGASGNVGCRISLNENGQLLITASISHVDSNFTNFTDVSNARFSIAGSNEEIFRKFKPFSIPPQLPPNVIPIGEVNVQLKPNLLVKVNVNIIQYTGDTAGNNSHLYLKKSYLFYYEKNK